MEQERRQKQWGLLAFQNIIGFFENRREDADVSLCSFVFETEEPVFAAVEGPRSGWAEATGIFSRVAACDVPWSSFPSSALGHPFLEEGLGACDRHTAPWCFHSVVVRGPSLSLSRALMTAVVREVLTLSPLCHQLNHQGSVDRTDS